MSSLISAAASVTSCRTLHNLKRMSAIGGFFSRSGFGTTAITCASDKIKDEPSAASTQIQTDHQHQESLDEVSDVILKEIPDSKVHWEYSQSSETARVYDTKPIKIKCKQDRMYMWCACGLSRHQPFCDGTHRHVQMNTTLKPIPWMCKKTGFYWFCNCKKSGKKVFCDGTHLKLQNDPTIIKTVKH